MSFSQIIIAVNISISVVSKVSVFMFVRSIEFDFPNLANTNKLTSY
jgi:hypothetical protein